MLRPSRAAALVAANLSLAALAACSEPRSRTAAAAAPSPADPQPAPAPADPQAAYLAARRAEVAAMPDPPAALPRSSGTRQELAYMIELGEKLLRETNTHPLTAPYVAASGLTCSSCHLDAGRKKAIASTFIGAAASFPAFNDRDGGVITLQDRVNGCFMRSMNGTRLPENSEALLAIVSYINWLSQGFPLQPNPDRAVSSLNRSFPNPAIKAMALAGKAVAANGASIYDSRCAPCHGVHGEGIVGAPPVWGERAYNKGAGMANDVQAGSWIQFNMPPAEELTLTDQEALDVAAFVNAQPHPTFLEAEHLPDGGGGYGGPEIVYHYGASFTAEQLAVRVPSGPTAGPAPDGAALYAARCAACHGALAASAVRGRTAAQISAAIAGLGSMAGLKDLSGAQLEAIAAALR
ncbi:cytochrome c class I [Anaeromyxobacter sp. K]|uniref:c-type cytochrome n=1 Tax=Anaeromyxobacter sp. (strain K) TaxID=447217 RepID=UPI00017BE24C|nr:c-type cytochrome [Anaeromyxobacter sp. K]ACG73808.1 cytochrome c class I [Anaeromyxobacter sp. K]